MIILPQPVVLATETPEQIQELLQLIKTAQTANYCMVLMTPQCAKALLALQSTHQRRMRPRAITQLVNDYCSNEYHFTGDALRFELGTGLGKDGQHRLQAQVDANVTAVQFLVFGLPSKAFEKIDGGRSRSVSDVIVLRGDGSDKRPIPTHVMTVAASLEASDFLLKKANAMSRTEKTAACDALTDTQMVFLGMMSEALQSQKIRTSGALGGALRAFRRYQDITTTEFLVATFTNEAANPSFLPELSSELFNYLNTSKSAQGNSQASILNQAAAIFRAVKALNDGTALGKLRAATAREIESLILPTRPSH